MKERLGIYIHIPFCASKCAYCDFVSHRVAEFEINNGIEAYFNALSQEIEFYKEEIQKYEIGSVYFGGGTPSIVNGSYISRVLKQLRSVTTFTDDVEITLEVNPGTLTEEKLNYYTASGVNRISMGLQTTNDVLLKQIGRIHSTNDFLTSYDAIKRSGIDNISLDLMFGLPNQTIDDVKKSIELIKTLSPKHVSTYSLKLEEGTPLYERYVNGKIDLPDDEIEREMYHTIENELADLGLMQYEISNFSLPGYESKHNLTYWKNKPYLGLGLSSHSKIGHKRFANTAVMSSYIEQWQAFNPQYADEALLDDKEELFETIMLGLRLNEGISFERINKSYNINFKEKYAVALHELKGYELIVETETHLFLTPKGRDLSNLVFLKFMD
ncbi:MAG: hypothetical protein BGO41_13050 [Clostridiales bacterium 38-18]|nr:MAG: hypothetical protein BGO41_13050 [Clostridiales bacterium 38-18]